MVRHSILQFATWLCESPWTITFPLVGAAVLTLGPLFMVVYRLGLWFQIIGVALSALLYFAYVVSVVFVVARSYAARPRDLNLDDASHALSAVNTVSRNRSLMLLLLLPFILFEIYIHITSLSSLDRNVFLVGGFFSLSFTAYLAVYTVLYFLYSIRDPLSGAVLYFAASAVVDEISSSIRLAASATEFLSKAITKNTGVLRMKAPEAFFAALFLQDQREEVLIQLAQSCGDIKNALTTLTTVTHTSAYSMLEHATLRERLLPIPVEAILGILTVLIDVFFRFIALGH